MNATPTDIVAGLQRQWMTAFGDRDFEALAQLYAEDCFLFGGKPALSNGRAAVRAYFNAVAPGARAEFGEQAVMQLAPAVIASAGFIAFTRNEATTRHRITFTLIQTGGAWKIASHHASPVPATPPA